MCPPAVVRWVRVPRILSLDATLEMRLMICGPCGEVRAVALMTSNCEVCWCMEKAKSRGEITRLADPARHARPHGVEVGQPNWGLSVPASRETNRQTAWKLGSSKHGWKIHPLNMMAPLMKGGLTIITPAKLCSRMGSTLTPYLLSVTPRSGSFEVRSQDSPPLSHSNTNPRT